MEEKGQGEKVVRRRGGWMEEGRAVRARGRRDKETTINFRNWKTVRGGRGRWKDCGGVGGEERGKGEKGSEGGESESESGWRGGCGGNQWQEEKEGREGRERGLWLCVVGSSARVYISVSVSLFSATQQRVEGRDGQGVGGGDKSPSE